MLPESIKKFVAAFSSLPSIGPRQATRLAFYIKNLGSAVIKEISTAVAGLDRTQTCAQCFYTYETDRTRNGQPLCEICSNPQRQKNLIAVVEKETDLISLEKTKKFNGRYLVCGELPKDGLLETAQKLRLQSLKNFIQKELGGQAEEILLAVNQTTYGDIGVSLLANELKGAAKKITQLGRGIPTGGEIEFADEDTLSAALDKRS